MNSLGSDCITKNITTDTIIAKTITCSGQISGNPIKVGTYIVQGSAASPVLFTGPAVSYTAPNFSSFPAKYVLVGSATGTAITSFSIILQCSSSPIGLLGNYEILPYCIVSKVGIDANITLEEVIATGLILTITFSNGGIIPDGNDAFQLSVSFNPLY